MPDIVDEVPETNSRWLSRIPLEVREALREIRPHLTKEEILCFSIHRNEKRKASNRIHIKFIESYFGKTLTSSGITLRKNRLIQVLNHVGELLRFKRRHGVDQKLRDILTQTQYRRLMLYERRRSWKEIMELENTYPAQISRSVHKAINNRLKKSSDPDIQRYLELLGNVLRFSRKYPIHSR